MDNYAKPCTVVIALCSLTMASVFRSKMYWRMEEPYLPVMANLACLVFFVTASLQQLHQQPEVTVSRVCYGGDPLPYFNRSINYRTEGVTINMSNGYLWVMEHWDQK